MSPRKRAAQDDESRRLPVREKRRRTNDIEEDSDLEESLSHIDQPIAKRALRSSHKSDVPVRLNDHGSPELAQEGVASSKLKKSHVKFGSESPPPVLEEEEKSHKEVEGEEDEDEESDDDEAPEAISHSHAEAETKAVKAQEARLLKQLELEERDKRRKRDAQLKAQVKGSEKRRSRAEEEKEGADEEAADYNNKKSKLDLDKLPEFLPEELLAIEAPTRAPTPPAQKNNTKMFIDALRGRHDDETPADVVHQGRKVRVLQTTNKLLPPKASGGPTNLRESWMQGRAAFQKADKKGRNLHAYRRRPGAKAFV